MLSNLVGAGQKVEANQGFKRPLSCPSPGSFDGDVASLDNQVRTCCAAIPSNLDVHMPFPFSDSSICDSQDPTLSNPGLATLLPMNQDIGVLADQAMSSFLVSMHTTLSHAPTLSRSGERLDILQQVKDSIFYIPLRSICEIDPSHARRRMHTCKQSLQ